MSLTIKKIINTKVFDIFGLSCFCCKDPNHGLVTKYSSTGRYLLIETLTEGT